jgi:hypothetical protein
MLMMNCSLVKRIRRSRPYQRAYNNHHPEIEDNADDELFFSEEDSEESTIPERIQQPSPRVERIMQSKGDNVEWSPSPQQSQGRLSAFDVLKMVPGPT